MVYVLYEGIFFSYIFTKIDTRVSNGLLVTAIKPNK